MVHLLNTRRGVSSQTVEVSIRKDEAGPHVGHDRWGAGEDGIQGSFIASKNSQTYADRRLLPLLRDQLWLNPKSELKKPSRR